MPGILPMKVIKVGSNAPSRIAQACDRCRSKKIRCDGFRPCCSQCATVGFECKTSDKLSRRAFPRGYTESLEERVRALEAEIHELKDLLDAKDEKIDVLTKIRSGSNSRRGSDQSASPPPTVTLHHSSSLTPGPGHDPYFVGGSSSRSIADSLKRKIIESGRLCPPLNLDQIFNVSHATGAQIAISNDAWKPPPRLVTDQMVNVFFQEWAPLFPVLHRPSFLSVYETYVAGPERVPGQAAQVQLNLVFGIAALSKQSRINHDTSIVETHWLCVLDTFIKQNTLANLQCCILAQIFCLQTGDYARLNYYRSQSIGMALRLGLHQSQMRFCLSTLAGETRKKVFWTLYALDCFAATVLGLPTLLDDQSIQCEYPVDVDDEYISEQGIQPVLPGDKTKLSSALQLFKAVRIISRTLSQLYPASATQEVPLQNITGLTQELDQWLSELPAHLRMEFANDKPATQTVSSRSPILALTYHFIKSLIHRPAACSADSDQASSSLLVLASSSKSIIQVLQLLEERNLSFSMCLNKNELITLCGCGLLLQTLGLNKDSVLLKDYQRMTCSVIEMLQLRAAPGEAEFRQLACSLISVRRDSMASPQSQMLDASPSYSPVSTGRSPSESTEVRDSGIHENHAPRKGSTSAIISSRSPPHSTRRFRPIAPSTRHQSRDQFIMASPTTPSLSDASSNKGSRSSASSSNANLNLDFFAFPSDAEQKSKARLAPSPQESSQEWDHLFESVAGEGSQVQDSPQEQPDWPSISDLLSPLQESATANNAAAMSPTVSADQKLVDEALSGADASRSSSAAKPQSLLSFSGESMTSAEDLGQYDWVSPEHEGVFAAAVDMPGAFATDEVASVQHDSPQAVA